MHKIITLSEMRSFSEEAWINESNLIKTVASHSNDKNVFLSYSSKDRDILPYPIKILTNHDGTKHLIQIQEEKYYET